MNDVIGTCSLCGGPVKLPNMMVNPLPCCQNCGAIAKRPHGPIIEMEGGDKSKWIKL